MEGNETEGKETESNSIEYLMIERVSYADSQTPSDQAEYRLNSIIDGPVGTIIEWVSKAQMIGLKGVKVVELDGSVRYYFCKEVEQ